MQPHFVGFGLVNHDTVACGQHLALDAKVRATNLFEQVGGPIPVALQCAMRLGGIRATQLGVVGSDALGDDLIQRLESFGVVSSLQRTSPTTSRSLVLLDTVHGTRLVANYAEQLPPFAFDAQAEEILRSADLLHLDGRDIPGSILAAQLVQISGGKVSLDLGTMRDGLNELFPLCDLILASKKGGAGAFPEHTDDPLAQVRGFLDAGAQIAGVTLGAEGLALGGRGGPEPFLLAPRQAEIVVDTCGAGDAFHGAFCHAWLLGASPEEAAHFAQALVCVRIGQMGNEAGLPTLEEIPRGAGRGATSFRSESAPAR
jgi:sugar/nucleoside kinase (ribokinase family)